jgi:hypothetical protein
MCNTYMVCRIPAIHLSCNNCYYIQRAIAPKLKVLYHTLCYTYYKFGTNWYTGLYMLSRDMCIPYAACANIHIPRACRLNLILCVCVTFLQSILLYRSIRVYIAGHPIRFVHYTHSMVLRVHEGTVHHLSEYINIQCTHCDGY